MTAFDFSPLFRSFIGFDRLADSLEAAYRSESGGYPPYNIERTGEDRYRISMAVAGFGNDQLDVEVKENILTVRGNKPEEREDSDYLYRGIANRSFERRFQLADYVVVEGAGLRDGLLHIELKREVPEAVKPRRIEIQDEGGRMIGREAEAA
ncbi:MAG: Hsp20 family protein [Chromatiales bacterium]